MFKHMYRFLTRLRSDGVRETLTLSRRAAEGQYYQRIPWHSADSIWGDWDLCIILDSCRPDLLSSLSQEYCFIPEHVDKYWSLGSNTLHWMSGNFNKKHTREMSKTGYICGNPFSNEMDLSGFPITDELWKTHWDNEIGTIRPEPLTQAAIHRGRATDYNLIVHYMQPHFPSIPDPLDAPMSLEEFGNSGTDWDIWRRLRTGDLRPERVWRSYRENCRKVLDQISLLLQNYDAERVMLTSDHGNAFGESGLWGHPPDTHHPAVRYVPEINLCAEDQRTIEPDIALNTTEGEFATENRLKDLGYK